MRYLRQLTIIFAVTLAAEVMKYFIPLPVPASIYGLILMFMLLLLGIIKPEQIKDTASFLTEIMPVMFIPAAVGLLASWDVIRPVLLPLAAIIVITTVLVMGITGRIAQLLVRRKERSRE